MTTIDLCPIKNNPDLPLYFQVHLRKRIVENGGYFGIAWKLIRRYREGRYCLARKAGGKLCLNTAKIPGDGPRGRCGWHGGTGRSSVCLRNCTVADGCRGTRWLPGYYYPATDGGGEPQRWTEWRQAYAPRTCVGSVWRGGGVPDTR